MKKQDFAFACIFTVTFLICGAFVAETYKEKILAGLNVKEYTLTEATDETMAMTEVAAAEEAIDWEQDSLSEAEDVDGNEVWETTEEMLQEEKMDMEEDESISVPVYQKDVGYEYFADALFIGDSRTVGIMEYGELDNAAFFAESGMSVFDLEKRKITIEGEGKCNFAKIISEQKYGKIYLMLGINELGYRFETVCDKYKETVEMIRNSQPDAILYLCANLHVTGEQSQKDTIYNNENINKVNEMIRNLCDEETLFYIDVNERFDDADGNLSTEYSSDSFHVYGRYYKDWVDWLCTKVVSK